MGATGAHRPGGRAGGMQRDGPPRPRASARQALADVGRRQDAMAGSFRDQSTGTEAVYQDPERSFLRTAMAPLALP